MSRGSYAGRRGIVHVVVLAAALVWGPVALAIAVLPELQFTYPGASLHVAVETAASLIALLAGFLVFGRLQRRGGLNDLLLATALAVFALLNLCLLTMPALTQFLSKDLIVWVLLIGRLLGAVLFVFATFVPPHRLRRPVLVLAVSVAGWIATVLLTAAIFHWLAGHVAHRPAAALALGSPRALGLGGYPALLTLQLVTTVLYVVATIGFLSCFRRFRDEFLGWLAASGTLAALSHLNYSLYPSPYAQLVHAADIFRVGSYVMLLVGSMREISSYWHTQSEAAVLEERQRIARDLHDGLAQELAYLARHLDSVGGERGEETRGLLRRAVARAQLESRRVVSTLATPGVEPVEMALAKAAAEVAERFDIGVQLGLALGVEVSPARKDAIVRIACEAVANAARHSGAGQVSLKLERDGSRVRLRVSDRGRGFDPAVPCGGFGLVAMRQRARSVGGELRISSSPGQGSEVEAVL